MYTQCSTNPAPAPAPTITDQAEQALYTLLDQISRVEVLIEQLPNYQIQFDALCHLSLSRAGIRHALADLTGQEA